MKTGFVPSHVKLRKSHGNIARSDERPETLAEYDDTKQWGAPDKEPDDISWMTIVNCTSDINTNPTTVDELLLVLKKMKNAKSPGPDGLPMEFFKWLREETQEGQKITKRVVDILNYCFENEIMPQDLDYAQVVTLYKKGNVEDPANYRPISLLQSQ